MSSLKNLNKSRARSHRERSQPTHRAHLGYLEKKKDYRERASEHHKKERELKSLKRKALSRNPDEYYFGMVKTHKVDGVHQRKEEHESTLTDAQIILMQTKDLRYVNMKRKTEQQKIKKLKESLHLLDGDDMPKNNHVVFVDSKKDVKNFDAAKHLNTHPSLISRTYNRPTLEMLQKGDIKIPADTNNVEVLGQQRHQRYKELTKRIAREKELGIIAEKLEMKKHLMDKKSKKKKVKEETKTQSAQYKWTFERKK